MTRLRRSRKAFIGGTAAAAASLLLPSAGFAALRRSRERVAIVGAGIAGLSCALTLQDAGITSTIFESSTRIGGRMHSESIYWKSGQHTEWCGAMIDSNHHTMRALAQRFQLPLDDALAPLAPHARDTSYFQRRYYPMTTADRDFAPVYRTLREQLAGLGPNTTYDSATPLARRLDEISMAQWIERYVPGGRTSDFGRLIETALMNEYGVDASLQSSLNLVYMLGIQHNYSSDGGKMNVLGYSDQRFNIRGGNQRLPLAIARTLPAGSIRFGHRLIAIAKRADGAYDLRFTTPRGDVKERFDRVVLAIPFMTLRGVDYSGAGFDERKHRAIQQLGYGIHTKLHVQFNGKPWYGDGPWPRPVDGQIWTDLGFQNSVDFSLGQSGDDGIIERFTAGTVALIDTPAVPYARIEQSPAVARHVKHFFEMLDQIWPGVSKHWNGKATLGNAQADPNIQASYSCWLVGQYTTIAGYEHVRQGRIHFAGEHCSVENQGFMEGGAATGVAAASEILADYGAVRRLG
jgi:monoamine oxidase